MHPDVNRDHRALFDSVAVATRPVPGQSVRRVLTYAPTSSTEWTPSALNWFVPNWFVDVTDTLDRKLSSFAHYRTEARDYPHPRSERAIRSAAEFYGASCGCEAAEPSCSCARSTAETPSSRERLPRAISRPRYTSPVVEGAASPASSSAVYSSWTLPNV